MRQIGTVPSREEAQRLAAFLLVRGIKGQVEPEGERWAVWVFEEDQLATARDAYSQFIADPKAPEFLEAESAAAQILDDQLTQHRKKIQVINLRERWQPPVPARQFITMILMSVSVIIAITSNFGEKMETPLMQNMLIASYQEVGDRIVWRGLSDIKEGEVWRLITPIFLHFSIMHLLFNMLWMFDVGMLIEDRRGHWRYLLLVVVSAVISNFSQYWWSYFQHVPPMRFGGMSGVVYALIGYIWMKSRFQPSAGLYLTRNTVLYAVIWLVVCMLGWMGSIANAAHVVGFAVGILMGLIPFL